MPIATTILGKSVISEAHPLFAGIYEGAMGRPEVTELVESADCLLMLGCFLTDINLGIFTAKLDPSRCIDATSENLRIRHHHYRDVRLDDFIRGLIARKLVLNRTTVPRAQQPVREASPRRRPATVTSVHPLRPAQPDAGRASRDDGDRRHRRLAVRRGRSRDAPAHRVPQPGVLHLDGLRRPRRAWGPAWPTRHRRVLVVVGDGAFQMTGMELSTIAQHRLNPIIVVLNNHGYTTERFLLEGPFNEIHNWAYHRVPDVLGAGMGLEVHTVGRARRGTQEGARLHRRVQSAERPP